MTRVVAIGLDSADKVLIERLIAQGRLPHLARLTSLSAQVPLHSDIIGKPEEAWTSFLYGDDSYNAGYWSSLKYDASTYRAYRQGAFLGPPFYAGQKIPSLIFDVPKTTAHGDVKGTQITSWGAHAASFPRASIPPGMIRSLDERFGPHPALENEYFDGWYQTDYIDQLSDSLVQGAAQRTKATQSLIDDHPDAGFILTVLSETHSGGHHLWHGVDSKHILAGAPTAAHAGRRLTEIYEAVDATLGSIVERLTPDTHLVVFSVHGMCPNDSDVAAGLLLPELLHRFNGGTPKLHGPDHKTWKARGYPPVLPDPRRRPLALAHDSMDTSLIGKLLQRAKAGRLLDLERALRKARGKPLGHRIPWKMADELAFETDITNLVPSLIEETATDYPNLWYQQHWPTMRAFSLPSFGEGRIRINLAGRDRDGVVALEDYERTCSEIEQLLKDSINPRTGKSIASHVIRTRKDDPFDPLAPDADLLITWDTAVDAVFHPTLGEIGPFPMLRMSEHSNDAFALISGPGIEPSRLNERPTSELGSMILSLLEGKLPT